jgi:hypothetical protein
MKLRALAAAICLASFLPTSTLGENFTSRPNPTKGNTTRSFPEAPDHGVCHDGPRATDYGKVFLVTVAIICLVSLPFVLFFGRRCPACRGNWALSKTGAIQKGGWWTPAKEEWKCTYCGHTEWRDEPRE